LSNHLVREVLNVGAASVTGAIVGANSSSASLALIAREALTLTTLTVANTTSRALSILVMTTNFVRSIDPSDIEGADALGAISTVVREAEAPVVVASADTALTAGTVTRAGVVTTGIDNSHK
jgi:hypothetical protein